MVTWAATGAGGGTGAEVGVATGVAVGAGLIVGTGVGTGVAVGIGATVGAGAGVGAAGTVAAVITAGGGTAVGVEGVSMPQAAARIIADETRPRVSRRPILIPPFGSNVRRMGEVINRKIIRSWRLIGLKHMGTVGGQAGIGRLIA